MRIYAKVHKNTYNYGSLEENAQLCTKKGAAVLVSNYFVLPRGVGGHSFKPIKSEPAPNEEGGTAW